MPVYIQRDMDAALIAWKTEWNRKPLLLRGVRQCGKTSAVRHFADQLGNFGSYDDIRVYAAHKIRDSIVVLYGSEG